MENAFIFDDVLLTPEQQIPIHAQNEWELSYIIRGQGTKFLGEEIQPFCEGEVILIPPKFPHGWFFDGESTDDDGHIHNITILFASDLPARLALLLPELTQIADVFSSICLPRRFLGKTAVEISCLLEDMRDLDSAGRLPMFLRLLLLIAGYADSEEIGCKPIARTTRNADKLRIYCKCNFHENITLEKTAVYMNMNKSSLCKFIKKQTGQTFTEYINSLRLEKAALLLTSTPDPACDIAYDCGFTNVTYFHRLFARNFGMTPCNYRKKYCQDTASHTSCGPLIYRKTRNIE